jgi:hypothetical protein
VLLSAGLAISVVVGSLLGRAWHAREEPEPFPEEDSAGSAALIAEAMGIELEPGPEAAMLPEGSERRTQVAQALGRPERTGQAALRQRLPLPPKAGPLISIGDQLDAHGVPMNLATFETQLSVREVLEFYARHFEAQSWPYSDVPSARQLVPHPALSATLLEEELQLTVMVMPHGEGEGNTVVLGLADMEAFRKGASKEQTGDLPAYPGTHPVAVVARDEGKAALTVSFDTPDAPARVEDFYRKALAQRGYTEINDPAMQDDAETGLRMLHFASRRGRAWNLALSAQGQGTSVTAQGTLGPEGTP